MCLRCTRPQVVETLFPAKTGWAVHRRAPCVSYAIEWAFSELSATGAVQRLVDRWLTPQSCTAVGWAADEEASGGRRRLGASRGLGVLQNLTATTVGRATARRRLASADGGADKIGGGEGGGGEPSDTYNGVSIIGVPDFFGIILLWIFVTVTVVATAALNAYTGNRVQKTGKHLVRQFTSKITRGVTHPPVKPTPTSLTSRDGAGEHHANAVGPREGGGGTRPMLSLNTGQDDSQQLIAVLQDALANVQQMQADLIAQVNAVTAISPPATEPKPGWVVAPA